MKKNNFGLKTLYYVTKIILLFFLTSYSLLNAVKTICLEGLYVTSVNINHNKFGAYKLFDNTSGYWATMPGAAPDEGVMLYFENKIYISKIKLVLPKNNQSISKIKTVKLYVNGKLHRNPKNNKEFFKVNFFIKINKKIKSLFIRIVNVDGIVTKKIYAGDNENNYIFDYDMLRTKQYKSKLPTGIDEIIFYGKKNVRLTIKPPHYINGEIFPSSILQPPEAYNADFLFDSRKEFGWVEGSKKSGKGETIKFIFNTPVTISKIKLWNGYQRSKVHFTANERVKKISFGLPMSTAESFSIRDSMDPQVVKLSKSLTAKKFILKIEDIYKGMKYTDCVISELRFFDGLRWFMVNTGNTEQMKIKLLNRLKDSVLGKIIDKRIDETYIIYDGGLLYSKKSKSIILRSNNSFVIWVENLDKQTQTYSETKMKVADGNWEIKKISKNKAVIKIFGKILNVTKDYEYYSGTKKKQNIVIFHDVLTITKNAIIARDKKVFNKITLH